MLINSIIQIICVFIDFLSRSTVCWEINVLESPTVFMEWTIFPMSEWVKVTQSCPTLCNPMDYADHGILQARILELVAFPFSRGSSQLRDRNQVSCMVDFLPAEPQGKPISPYNLGKSCFMYFEAFFLIRHMCIKDFCIFLMTWSFYCYTASLYVSLSLSWTFTYYPYSSSSLPMLILYNLFKKFINLQSCESYSPDLTWDYVTACSKHLYSHLYFESVFLH